MNKKKLTLEIESRRRNERRLSKLEKLVSAFTRLWKVTLASDLRSNAKTKLLRLIIISSALLVLTYLILCILTLILNRL